MFRNVYSVSVSLLLVVGSACSCIRKPGRPNTELCLWMSEAQVWECEDAFKNVRTEKSQENLMCTTLDGYAQGEKYVDLKEKRVRELERELAQCKRK